MFSFCQKDNPASSPGSGSLLDRNVEEVKSLSCKHNTHKRKREREREKTGENTETCYDHRIQTNTKKNMEVTTSTASEIMVYTTFTHKDIHTCAVDSADRNVACPLLVFPPSTK